jgi:hypothetical protein
VPGGGWDGGREEQGQDGPGRHGGSQGARALSFAAIDACLCMQHQVLCSASLAAIDRKPFAVLTRSCVDAQERYWRADRLVLHSEATLAAKDHRTPRPSLFSPFP